MAKDDELLAQLGARRLDLVVKLLRGQVQVLGGNALPADVGLELVRKWLGRQLALGCTECRLLNFGQRNNGGLFLGLRCHYWTSWDTRAPLMDQGDVRSIFT